VAGNDPKQPLKKTNHRPPYTGISVQKLPKVITTLLGVVVFILIAGLLTERLFLSSIVVAQGRSFGFEIGQTRQAAFETANSLLLNGGADVIHIWPDGESHRPFFDGENLPIDDSARLKIIVNSDWWNNSILLTFDEGLVVRIRRTRVIWEMP
jgi:hypothetical protein